MSGIPGSAVPDLLRALTLLQPADDAALATIARLFGVEVAMPAAPEAAAPDPGVRKDRPVQVQTPPAPPRAFLPSPPQPASLPVLPHSAASDSEISSALVPDYSERRRPPGWLESVDPFPEAAEAAEATTAPVLEPLLVPQWARGVLGSAVATVSEAGPLDVERLVRGIARGVPWRRLPREPWPTLARGVQVLVDRADALLPFAADQAWLVEQVAAVAGRDRVQALDFEGCPSWGAGAGSQWEWEDYFGRWSPPSGTPVLVLSDLGIGASTGSRVVHPAEWRAFADRLRRAGCPLVAFVPYARERWPAGLEKSLRILPWDRATSARTVRRILGKALRAPGWERL